MRTLVLAVLVFAGAVHAQVVDVRLEPFPPLVTENGGGLTVRLLREIEKISDLRFSVAVVPYSRAKYQLRNGQADLIGHTPVGYESAEFYSYARELSWQIPTAADLFAMHPQDLDLLKGGQAYYVGAPLGNAEFFSELFDVPLERFVESTLPNLVEMLARGRIQALMFERASTRAYIWQARLQGVHYRLLKRINAGLAVRRDAQGEALALKLESLLGQLDLSGLMQDYLSLVEEPAREGVLTMCPPTDETNAFPRVCPQE